LSPTFFAILRNTMAEPSRSKQSQPDTPPERRNRVGAIAADANAAASMAFTRAGFRDPTLVLHWSEIAGAEVARIATPVKLSEGNGGGVLTLKAEPGAALFLQHETRPLCERINAYLGRAAVSRLRFVQGQLIGKPLPRKRLKHPGTVPGGDAALTFSGPDKVREALLALAKARLAGD
jgi:hypothetical protein